MVTMKLKAVISGPKVHDVGYRYFLMSVAMSNRIKMFEAHNTDGCQGQEVLVFADGDESAIEAFRASVEIKRPSLSQVSNIVFDDFEGEIMRIGEYAQFCSTVQLNKAIPVLLDMRDDLKAVRKTTDATYEEIKAVRKTTDATYEEIKAVRKTTDATLEETKAVRKTTDATLEEIKAVRMNSDLIPQMKANTDAIPTVLEEIKGLRDDIQPGYGMSLRQVPSDIRAIKDRLGML